MVLAERRRRRTAGFLLTELEPSHASGQSSETGRKRRRRKAGKTRGKLEETEKTTKKLESDR